MKYLIVGLGNIGPEYELTRHNIGFLALDKIADEKGCEFEHQKLANKTEFKYKGRTIHMIKPTTFMNRSGKAVNYWMKELKVPIENILVITDDLALPFGKLRLRGKGSSAGHNGLEDINQNLGTNTYSRLKFGIDSDFQRGRQADYVLTNFSSNQLNELPSHLDKVFNMVLGFCTIGLQRTMNQFN